MRNNSRLKVENVEPEIKFKKRKDVNHNKDVIFSDDKLKEGQHYFYWTKEKEVLNKRKSIIDL